MKLRMGELTANLVGRETCVGLAASGGNLLCAGEIA